MSFSSRFPGSLSLTTKVITRPVACIWYSNVPTHRFNTSLIFSGNVSRYRSETSPVFLPHHSSAHSESLGSFFLPASHGSSSSCANRSSGLPFVVCIRYSNPSSFNLKFKLDDRSSGLSYGFHLFLNVAKSWPSVGSSFTFLMICKPGWHQNISYVFALTILWNTFSVIGSFTLKWRPSGVNTPRSNDGNLGGDFLATPLGRQQVQQAILRGAGLWILWLEW